jgi:hypothetical protein
MFCGECDNNFLARAHAFTLQATFKLSPSRSRQRG